MTPYAFHITLKDMAWLVKVAMARNEIKQGRVATQKRSLRHTDEEIHLLGVMAEFAVATPLGLQVNAEPLLGGDGGIADLYLPDMRSVAVKGVFNKDYPLYFQTLDDFRADLAVLATPTSPNAMRVCGWVTQGEFFTLCKDLPWDPPVYAVQQSQLTPFEELIEEVLML